MPGSVGRDGEGIRRRKGERGVPSWPAQPGPDIMALFPESPGIGSDALEDPGSPVAPEASRELRANFDHPESWFRLVINGNDLFVAPQILQERWETRASLSGRGFVMETIINYKL